MPHYRFYLLDPHSHVLGAVDIAFPSDEAAIENARLLLSSCHAVDVLRGALVLERVLRRADDPLPESYGRRLARR